MPPVKGGSRGAISESKMSNEPLERGREPSDLRARLEALVRANTAPRCGARSKRMGLERSRRAKRKRGYYSREAKAERLRVRSAILALRYMRMLGH